MVNPRLPAGLKGPALVLVALCGAMLLPGLAPAQDLLLPQAPANGLKLPPADVGNGRILVAQNKDTAQLLVRIQDLEDSVRTLTGQVEGLQFQLTQMQTLLQRMTEDNEARFQALEGGAGKKPVAAAPTDGATPSDAPPQDQANANAEPVTPPVVAADEAPSQVEPNPLGGDQPPMDLGLGDSNDPLLKGGSDQLGTLPEDQASIGPANPLDLDLGANAELSNGDAKAQYQAGYDAVTRGDYAFAADQFQQFVGLYPADPQAPDATNWLGEALIQQGKFTDAAQVLADGYTKYKDSKRAPDMMLKLGIALVGAEQQDVACRTFFTLGKRYPNLTPAFRQRLDDETAKAKCPVSAG